MSGIRVFVFLLIASVFVGCVHPRDRETSARANAERRLLILESEFAAFVARRLDRNEDSARVSPLSMWTEVDLQTAALESLRLRYLDVMELDVTHRQRLIAMVRIAELHLDLACRVRRLPYPPDASLEERRAWDSRLSGRALPLEAIGLGVLEQVDDYARLRGLDGRFVRRARVYLALHTARRMSDDDLFALRQALKANGPFGPAPRLLSTGRIGQRAARR